MDEGRIAVLTIHAFHGTAEEKELTDYFDDVFRRIHEHNSSSLDH